MEAEKKLLAVCERLFLLLSRMDEGPVNSWTQSGYVRGPVVKDG